MKHLGLALGIAGLLVSASSEAADPGVGTVAIGGSLAASATVYDGNVAGNSTGTSLTALPTMDVLVGRGWSLGVALPIVWQKWKSESDLGPTARYESTFVQPGLQVGYFIPIGEYAALWPVARGSYGFGSTHQDNGNGTSADSSSRILEASLTPQVLVLPTRSFFLRFSPGALSYRHQRWEGQAGTVGMLGISPFFFMGVGVML